MSFEANLRKVAVQRLVTMGPRRKAREYALQMLFQWDITHDAIDQIAANFFENLRRAAGRRRVCAPACDAHGRARRGDRCD